MSARHSRVQSSTTTKMRKRRPSINWSATKSTDQQSFCHCVNSGFTMKPSRSQQDMQPPIAEVPSLMGKSPQPLAQLERRTYMSDSLSLGSGRLHFFASRSFSAALSSMASANSFFSLAFSLSSPLRRLASETSSPPYLAFQL